MSSKTYLKYLNSGILANSSSLSGNRPSFLKEDRPSASASGSLKKSSSPTETASKDVSRDEDQEDNFSVQSKSSLNGGERSYNKLLESDLTYTRPSEEAPSTKSHLARTSAIGNGTKKSSPAAASHAEYSSVRSEDRFSNSYKLDSKTNNDSDHEEDSFEAEEAAINKKVEDTHTTPLVNLTNPQRTLSKEMKSLLNSPDFCDVIFRIGDTPLYAHRAILAARCPKFAQMFSALKKDTSKPQEIPIKDIHYDVFLAMVEFLYSDGVEISLENCLDLMGAATLFSLDLLRSLCERILEQSVSASNVCWIFAGSDRFKATRLRDICLSFIVKNFDQVTKSRSFEELSRDLILEVIRKR
ncbi:regulator of chromosome condensation (RCC1)-like protein [Planoprotostelium fungivorum]|uniref:Regulator of chromosome condensation (RCC1)-like protein n=1 Tax=Planoprotostelium fungivorum TaxID=1890364 RepID=A0A2P6NWI2_9EUKA|nr:regulator of chromosome condensation (RCC1)-like protein [Planoprotostelium fungivorum]